IRERDSAAPSALTLVSLPSLVIRVCLALPAELVEHWPTEPIIAAKLINGLQCAHCAFSFSRRAALCVPVQRSLSTVGYGSFSTPRIAGGPQWPPCVFAQPVAALRCPAPASFVSQACSHW